MSFKERLEKAAQHAGVPFKQTAIARFLGLPRQTVHQWFHGATPEPKQNNEAAAKFAVDPTWLANGQADMVPSPADSGLSSDEKDIIKFYRKAQPHKRKVFYDIAKTLGKVVVVAALSIPGMQSDAALHNTFARPLQVHNTHWTRIRRWLTGFISRSFRIANVGVS